MSGTETETSGALQSSQSTELGQDVGSSATSVKTVPSDPTRGGSDDSSKDVSGDAGKSKDISEDGRSQDQAGRQNRQWNKYDEIKELRAERRELRGRVNELMSAITELRDVQNGQKTHRQPDPRDPGQSKVFWDDPDARFNDLATRMDAMQDNVKRIVQEARDSERAQVQLDQERTKAVEWIRSQSGHTPEDEDDLVEIIHENGLDGLPPMRAARIAMSLLRDERGVADRSTAKARASTVVGKPPVGGKKVWSKTELDAVLDDCMRHPEKLTPELEREIIDAQTENRIR